MRWVIDHLRYRLPDPPTRVTLTWEEQLVINRVRAGIEYVAFGAQGKETASVEEQADATKLGDTMQRIILEAALPDPPALVGRYEEEQDVDFIWRISETWADAETDLRGVLKQKGLLVADIPKEYANKRIASGAAVIAEAKFWAGDTLPQKQQGWNARKYNEVLLEQISKFGKELEDDFKHAPMKWAEVKKSIRPGMVGLLRDYCTDKKTTYFTMYKYAAAVALQRQIVAEATKKK